MIVVFGATGFTGRLCVEALQDLGVKDVVLGGRSRSSLAELSERTGFKYRVADATNSQSLRELVRGAQVVVSCAGPFARFGEPVVSAALHAKAHFLDTTGEQAYMMRVVERYHGAAVLAKVAVVNAHAFEFALGSCAASLLAETHPELDTLHVFNRVQGVRNIAASRGTLKSGLGALAEPGYERKRGVLVPRGVSPLPRRAHFPDNGATELAVPFPGGEAIHLIKQHPQLKNVSTNLVVPKGLAAPLMAAWSLKHVYKRVYERGLLKDIEARIDQGSEGPSDDVRRQQAFKVLAVGSVGGKHGTEQSVLVTGTDPYGITARCIAIGAKWLVTKEAQNVGVVDTASAFGAREFLQALEPYGVRVSTPGSVRA
ncbi:MAG: saccharopine dehydrogenase NADP-binding domain-containing protein [Myxococcales bacterium]|nr:saccharopine dehydrogenase NADP-binding domain-containing protein [Myxococcales bacterium]MCB9609334.1 saccharopine dehydrogenase NADP-binding domain-containing protein [Polyangiaceae bacterium]